MCVTQAAQQHSPQPLDCFAATFKTTLESDWRVLLLAHELFGFDTDHSPQEGFLAVLNRKHLPALNCKAKQKNNLAPL